MASEEIWPGEGRGPALQVSTDLDEKSCINDNG